VEHEKMELNEYEKQITQKLRDCDCAWLAEELKRQSRLNLHFRNDNHRLTQINVDLADKNTRLLLENARLGGWQDLRTTVAEGLHKEKPIN
jgi:hypothetical protein